MAYKIAHRYPRMLFALIMSASTSLIVSGIILKIKYIYKTSSGKLTI